MQNIWGIVVGVVLAAGVGAVVYKLVDGEPERPRVEAPVTAPSEAATPASTAEIPLPRPDAHFDQMPVTAEDHQLGNPDAPITIIEYASLTCPHCAQFDVEVLPKLKAEYIDTGKVRFVFRDFPLDRVALAGSVIARCAGRDRFFGFIGTFFASQSNWARAQNPVEALSRIARLGGLSDAQIDACLKDQKIADAVLAQRLDGEKAYKVASTPTLFINGDRYAGGLRFEELKRLLDSMLPKS